MSGLPVMNFDIKEKVKLSNEEQSFNELSSLELEPVVKVYDFEKEVEVTGYLVLYGEFYIRNQYLEEGLDQFDALHFDSALNNYKIDSFQHRIPVSIKIDSMKVEDTSKVLVEVENFDYQVISDQEIEVTSSLKLIGVKQEKTNIVNAEGKSERLAEEKIEILQVKNDDNSKINLDNSKVPDTKPIYSLLKEESKQDFSSDEKYIDFFENENKDVMQQKDLDVGSEGTEDDITNNVVSEGSIDDDAKNEGLGTKTMLFGLLKGNENNQYKMKMYLVQKEDTIDEIAGKYGISTVDIINQNKLEDNNLLEGQLLFLPTKK